MVANLLRFNFRRLGTLAGVDKPGPVGHFDAIIASMKTVQDVAAFLFVTAVAVLTAVCVLGVLKIFGQDVVWKSFQTIGLLALATVIVLVAGRFVNSGGDSSMTVYTPNSAFPAIRRLTLGILVCAAALMAFAGVLAIWEVVSDQEMLYRLIGSLAVLAFGAFIIVVTCMEREKSPLLKQQKVSVGGVVAALILLYLIFVFSGLFV